MRKLLSLFLALAASMVVMATPGALKGKFTINDKGDQIVFSQGYLQYQASTDTWRFSDNDMERCGNNNSYKNISPTYDGWIDLFGWGTGNNPLLISKNGSDYATFVDWGVNPISNGGNKPNLWRTLTVDEWLYIIKERPNAENLYYDDLPLRFADKTWDYLPRILLPDDWTMPLPTNEKGKFDEAGYEKMKAAGAVFLFGLGTRFPGGIVDLMSFDGIWTSTPCTDADDEEFYTVADDEAYYYDYYQGKDHLHRAYGFAVRLVQSADEPEPLTLYGVKESDGKTLTLYYDDQRAIRGGEKNWAMKYYENTTKVILDESVKEARPDNLEYWFADFNQLTEIEHLDYLNTSDVTNMNSLFLNCYALKSLDLSAFDTKKVESMGSMFGACTALKELNLNSLDVQKVTDAWGMFKGCAALKTILCDKDWSEQLPSECDTEEMFEECTSLVGGKGTAYSEEHTDGAYARPDKGESKPGYFTASTVYYTVTFLDWDATELLKEKVEEGKDAKGPDPDPTREGYTFIGWSKPITNITSDLTVIAQYEQNPPTGVENTEYRIQNTDKILRDGHLYILVGDKIYDATGKWVR